MRLTGFLKDKIVDQIVDFTFKECFLKINERRLAVSEKIREDVLGNSLKLIESIPDELSRIDNSAWVQIIDGDTKRDIQITLTKPVKLWGAHCPTVENKQSVDEFLSIEDDENAAYLEMRNFRNKTNIFLASIKTTKALLNAWPELRDILTSDLFTEEVKNIKDEMNRIKLEAHKDGKI